MDLASWQDTGTVEAGFRDLMSSFPSGVSIVTANGPDGAPLGMTCSALCSVTTEPPTLLVGIRAGGRTLDAVLARGAFAVNLLHAGSRDCATLFASADPDRFRMTGWRQSVDGCGPHLIDAAHTVADCRVANTVRVGAQLVVFGEVVRVTKLTEEQPLLYGFRRYASWPAEVRP